MEDPVQRAIPCHAHPSDIFSLGPPLPLNENKNPKKKPLMERPHQKKTELTFAHHIFQASSLAQVPMILAQVFTAR